MLLISAGINFSSKKCENYLNFYSRIKEICENSVSVCVCVVVMVVVVGSNNCLRVVVENFQKIVIYPHLQLKNKSNSILRSIICSYDQWEHGRPLYLILGKFRLKYWRINPDYLWDLKIFLIEQNKLLDLDLLHNILWYSKKLFWPFMMDTSVSNNTTNDDNSKLFCSIFCNIALPTWKQNL